ncbi:unnamed protein product, partial [Medioppia subpectinata]
GEEIIMECSVNSNPLAKVILFTHHGIQLVTDSQSGIIVNNSSLVITSARPIHRGSYQCLAINSQGKDAPVCRQLSTTVRVLSLDEPLRLLCAVDAEPADGLRFQWRSNSTAFLSGRDFVDDGSVSALTLPPDSVARLTDPTDPIQCTASNAVGVVREPCVYHFAQPTRPVPVTDCQLRNLLDSPQTDTYDMWTVMGVALLVIAILVLIIITIICKIRVRDRNKCKKNDKLTADSNDEQSLAHKMLNNIDNQKYSIYLVPNDAIDQNILLSDIRNPDLIPEIYDIEGIEGLSDRTDCLSIMTGTTASVTTTGAANH